MVGQGRGLPALPHRFSRAPPHKPALTELRNCALWNQMTWTTRELEGTRCFSLGQTLSTCWQKFSGNLVIKCLRGEIEMWTGWIWWSVYFRWPWASGVWQFLGCLQLFLTTLLVAPRCLSPLSLAQVSNHNTTQLLSLLQPCLSYNWSSTQ